MKTLIELEKRYSPDLFKSAPIVITRGQGAMVYDLNDKPYLDMMSAISVANFGHGHPRLLQALCTQAGKIGMTSRLYHSETLGMFLQRACDLTGMDQAIPLNSGTEAMETAIKAARKWAYSRKGVEEDQAEIIVCEGNFHGRTITVISASTENKYKEKFGPLTPGFKIIPFNDCEALTAAITPRTAAFIVEPVQGEAGVIVPNPGYLRQCQAICAQHRVLFICDEIQSGLGRTGKILAGEHEQVRPDGVLLGKSLGGGLLPVSLFLGQRELMSAFSPGDHGSTFGGNPLAAAVAYEALNVLVEEQLCENAKAMGDYFLKKLNDLKSPLIKSVRGQGLLIGLEINTDLITVSDFCAKLAEKGLLTINTRNRVIRLLPPLNITSQQIDSAVAILSSTVIYFF
jgi:ornithine--oxo-acid transaminase